MVWRDEWFALATCPVRALTPETKETLAWFDRTHEPHAAGFTVLWQRVSLPGPGGVSDQDARLMAALDHVRDLKNALLHEPTRRTRREDGYARDDQSDRGHQRPQKRPMRPRG